MLSLGGGAAGQVDSSFLRKAGPSIQTSLSAKAMAESPLVGRSAGFNVPGTCRHCSGLDVRCISPIRLATNGLNSRLWLRTQYHTFSESVQKMVLSTEITFRIFWARRLERMAPISSNRGIVIAFTGDTRHFDAIRRDDGLLSWYRQTK